MNKYLMFILVAICIPFLLYLGNDIFTLIVKGINVEYQRSTGPEFRVLKDYETVKKEFSILKESEKVDFSEIYVTNNLDTQQGSLRSGELFKIIGNPVGFKSVDQMGIEYPLMTITKILSYRQYQLKLVLFTVVLVLCTTLIIKVIRFF